MLQPLSVDDLNKAFRAAMLKVRGYIGTHDLNCSTDVVLDGLSSNDKFAVEMWFDGRENRFHLTFSRHYLRNKREKVEKMFFRYIATSNLDGTFKNYTQVKDELRKLPFETHYDVTYQNDFLATDVDEPFNGVICEKCHRTFRYDPGARIFAHPERFMCVCGGSLTTIVDGVKQVNANSVDRYLKCDPRQLDALRNVDLTPLKGFSQGTQEAVRAALTTAGKLNTKVLRPLVVNAVEGGDAELLRALDAVFPTLYAHVYSKLSADLRRRVCTLAVPTGAKLDEVKATSGWAATRWADGGDLLAAATAAFFGEAVVTKVGDAAASPEVQVDIVPNPNGVPELAPWPPELTRQVAAIFFNERCVEVAAATEDRRAAIVPAKVDWPLVTAVFFNEEAEHTPSRVQITPPVPPAKPAPEPEPVVIAPATPEPIQAPAPTVDWAAVAKVFFGASPRAGVPVVAEAERPRRPRSPRANTTAEPSTPVVFTPIGCPSVDAVDWEGVRTVFFDQGGDDACTA